MRESITSTALALCLKVITLLLIPRRVALVNEINSFYSKQPTISDLKTSFRKLLVGIDDNGEAKTKAKKQRSLPELFTLYVNYNFTINPNIMRVDR